LLVRQAPRLPHTIRAIKVGDTLGYPTAVAQDRSGLLYILHRGEDTDPVLVVNPDGRVIRSWGKGLFKIPHSIRIDPGGNIWTVDAASSTLMKFTPDGRKLMEIAVGGQPAVASGFSGTTDVAFGPDGRLFISDGYGNARILEYTADGRRVREWGSPGSGPGQFQQPHGIAVDSRGVIYVADRRNGRVQRFNLDGKYLGEWTHLGMVTTVALHDHALWIGTQQRDEPTSAAGWLMKIDTGTGKILGVVESQRGHHILNVSAGGDLLSGARPDRVLWFASSLRPGGPVPNQRLLE
jgi:DNA-binding beta-propeller fold protein YncE